MRTKRYATLSGLVEREIMPAIETDPDLMTRPAGERVKVGQAMARVLRDWGVVTYDDGYDTELRSYVLTDAGFRMTAGPEDQRFWDAYFMEMEQLT